MDYQGKFEEALGALSLEGRYRVFADIVRRRGEFPSAGTLLFDTGATRPLRTS